MSNLTINDITVPAVVFNTSSSLLHESVLGSFEAIRTVVLEVGKKITAREKEEIELNKKGHLIAGDKDVVALFEEADGIFINLQGKDRQEALEEQEKNKR